MATNQEKINGIGEEMAGQDNRATQWPLFVVQVKTRTMVDQHDDWNEKSRKDDPMLIMLCQSCIKVSDSEMPEDCEHCDPEAFNYFKVGRGFDLRAGVFFTELACDAHIEANKYHYAEPRSFVISAWRNEEIQIVMNTIVETAVGIEKVPTHYK